MVIGQESTRLEMTLRDVAPRGRPDAGDLQVTVSLQCGNFGGLNEGVWIDAGAWDGFRSELRDVESTRQGAARLKSMSPADLELRIEAVDRAGHLRVEGHLGDYVMVQGQSREIRLTFAFALDSDLLPAVVREIESFAPTG